MAMNRLTAIEGRNRHRPDAARFVNGLPLAVIELKNPDDENATLQGAFNVLQSCKGKIPSLFRTNGRARTQGVIEGVLEKNRFLGLIRCFTVIVDTRPCLEIFSPHCSARGQSGQTHVSMHFERFNQLWLLEARCVWENSDDECSGRQSMRLMGWRRTKQISESRGSHM
ncbi:MAG: type I restriction endonuclease [Rhodobacteraceae bacterium]|nr:type I restriction endonuclease [Paracoccaceae bacterium]